jgi:hypothetical protein
MYSEYNIYNAPLPAWIRLLDICYHWKFVELKEFAIREIQKHPIDPFQKIILYHTYDVGEDLLVPSYVALCMREEALTPEEGHALGIETAITLCSAREGTIRLSGYGVPHSEIGNVEDIVRDIFGVRESPALSAPADHSPVNSTLI